MIAIVNPDPTGWRNYEVRINHEVIATFRHRREHGLARCLRMAAAAVEDVWARSIAQLLALDKNEEEK